MATLERVLREQRGATREHKGHEGASREHKGAPEGSAKTQLMGA